MSEQREMPEVLPGDLITRVGLYEARCGDIVRITGWRDGFWVSVWNGVRTYYSSDGRQRFDEWQQPNQWQLLHWVGPLPATEPEPETTTEQLMQIEGQAESTPATEYTPTEHWRVLQTGEPLKGGDEYHEGLNQYIRRTEPQSDPQPQPQPLPQPESDAELRIGLLKQCNDNQAETIKRLMAEARDLNMEIGGLQRQLSQRDARIQDLETMHSATTKSFEDANKANDALRFQVQTSQQEASKKASRIEFLETLNAGNGAAIDDYRAQASKLQGLVDTARQQLEAAATERDELRAAIDEADKQLDQKDAEIRDLRIELDAAQQVPQPVSDEEREQIWDQATEQAGRRVIGWLRPLTLALNRQPDARFSRFMAMTLSILPDILPELLGYAVEDESDCEE